MAETAEEDRSEADDHLYQREVVLRLQSSASNISDISDISEAVVFPSATEEDLSLRQSQQSDQALTVELDHDNVEVIRGFRRFFTEMNQQLELISEFGEQDSLRLRQVYCAAALRQ